MAQLSSLLDTGDKVASIVGAAATLAALWLALRGSARRRRNRPDPRLRALLIAQRTDAARHRYRFFGEHVPALSDLYVRPRARTDGPGERDKSRTVPATQILHAHRHAVLLGDAGAGKSTFLASVAGDLARRALARRGGGEVAVIVHASYLLGRRPADAFARAVQHDLGVDLPAEVFDRPLPGKGTWRILIDGLDEVVAASDRSEVLWRIRDLLADTGPYRLLLTCRPLTEPELGELRGPDVGAYDLNPFDREELNEFARRWFTARYPDNRRRAEEAAGRFLARIAGARLGPVARIPLLTTIAALVYELQDGRTLPSSRAALYERFVDHLLDGRRSLDRFREAVEPVLVVRGVAGTTVADWLFSDIHRHISGMLEACGAAWLADPEVRLTDVAGGWIREHGPHDLLRVTPDGDRLLRELLLTTGICVLRRDRVVFAHQSFAEYFAARSADATFDPATWREQAMNPGTRSLAAFAAARRPESDLLITTLLDQGAVTAAGDLLADGVPVHAATQVRAVDLLLGHVVDEGDRAPDALRILGELSLNADVLGRMVTLAGTPDVPAWTRAVVADRIADVDPATGDRLLRQVADDADDAVREWIADAVAEHGGVVDPSLRLPSTDGAASSPASPLGVLGRHALARRLTDVRATESERISAAQQLARDGDLTALYAMVEAVDIGALNRVRIAGALADAGDPGPLRRLAAGADGSPATTYAAAVGLFERGDPEAAPALLGIVDRYPTYPMAFGAAARSGDLGDLKPLIRLSRHAGQSQVQLAAVRRLATLGQVPALTALLDDPLAPVVEAGVLAELLEAGHAEAGPRLSALLARHRFPTRQRIDFHYLLAAHGDRRSRDRLFRIARRRAGSFYSVEAAIALTALTDPRGAARLHRIAGRRWRQHRTRMRAALGLATADPAAGRRVIQAFTAAGTAPSLRLRAATVAVRIYHTVVPLARIALDPQSPLGHRVTATQVLTDVARGLDAPDIATHRFLTAGPAPAGRAGNGHRVPFPDSLRDRLVALALAGTTPARIRVAAAWLLPEAQARSVLGAIADGAEDASPRVRMAAIVRLDAVDGRAAGIAFGRLVRDRRIARLHRWLLVAFNDELLSDDDADALEERLGDLVDTESWRLALRALRLSVRAPEKILGPLGPGGSLTSAASR